MRSKKGIGDSPGGSKWNWSCPKHNGNGYIKVYIERQESYICLVYHPGMLDESWMELPSKKGYKSIMPLYLKMAKYQTKKMTFCLRVCFTLTYLFFLLF